MENVATGDVEPGSQKHLTRASTAFNAGDPVVGVTFLHLAAEAAVVALSELRVWERLAAGDDYILWTLRCGCVLHDDGILKVASRRVEESGLTPSAERKLIQAQRGLSLARLVLESGDGEAAREQCRAALTTLARWLLIVSGVFPLSRDELADQLVTLGCVDLANALHRLIHDQPSNDDLRAGLLLGRPAVAEREIERETRQPRWRVLLRTRQPHTDSQAHTVRVVGCQAP